MARGSDRGRSSPIWSAGDEFWEPTSQPIILFDISNIERHDNGKTYDNGKRYEKAYSLL